MTGKRLMILLIAAVFTLGVAGMSFSAQDAAGTISKIEGASVTILDATGKQVTVKVKDPKSVVGLKPGDRVLVKDGEVMKAGG